MKKIISVTCFVMVAVVLSLVLIACSNFEVNQIEREFAKISEVIEAFDFVADKDFDEVSFETSYAAQLSDVNTKRNELKVAQDSLVAKIDELKQNIETVLEYSKEIKDDAEVNFYDSEKDTFLNQLDDIKKIEKKLKNSNGKVSKPVADLSDKYTSEYYLQVISTYSQVNDVLNDRVKDIEKLIAIANDMIDVFKKHI